jgi:hypothetical protein
MVPGKEEGAGVSSRETVGAGAFRPLRLPIGCVRQSLLLLAAAPSFINAQTTRQDGGPGAALPVARAVRAVVAPALDGRDDDEIWRSAPLIQGFRQFEPAEEAEPTFPTSARVVYDERNLYVFVRAFDPHPDSLIGRLSRRDLPTNSDRIGMVIDAYHDRRTGVILGVNPAGVRNDAAVYQDNLQDATWDGVWEVATRVDSAGWTAEFRIPFSQLRFNDAPSHTFGFAVWRDIARHNERGSWPPYRPSLQRIISQLGTLEGLVGIRRSSRLELLPFVTTRNSSELRGDDWKHPQTFDAGLDLKYGIKENVTLDATINPDFGQVEADPAVLNLTAFEVRFDERRPFFQEGIGIFRGCQPCNGVFYTRRIGRTPQLRSSPGDPAFTTILGAAKLTGRVGGGITFGLVEALTQREVGASGRTIEPRTNYLVGRAAREIRQGRSSLGFVFTAVNRELDPDTDPFLRREAYTGVLEGYHRFAGERFEIAAYGARNRVTGSPQAIARTQLSSVHYFQRPDGEEQFDSTRRSMGGGVFSVSFAKIGGALRFGTFIRNASTGMELNDLGLVPLVNDRSIRNNVSLQSLRPSAFFRRTFSNLETENHWTSGGLAAGNAVRLHTSFQFLNSWGAALTSGLHNYGAAYCVSCARGGPAVRQSEQLWLQLNLEGDPRPALVPHLEAFTLKGDGGRSSERRASASFDLRIATRFSMTLGLTASRRVDNQQWVRNFGSALADTTHYTFARLRQSTVGVTTRASWTATPDLSLQLYAQPFVSVGSFNDWRELSDPRAARYDARYKSYGGGENPEGFNFKQFNSNVVLRWEYRPGSTLFLVWQQGRLQDHLNPGVFDAARDYRDLFRSHPENTLLVKLTYWFNP